MKQNTGTSPATTSPAQASSTGSGAEATTPAEPIDCHRVQAAVARIYEGTPGNCHATAIVHVTHDVVVIAAALSMGPYQTLAQRWERRRDTGTGWKRIEGPHLWTDAEARISTELAKFMDALDFPFALANMLPRRPTAAVIEAIEAAAQEVGNA
jgi:hypothetical protein